MRSKPPQNTAMQRVALGVAFAALICVSLAIKTGRFRQATATSDVAVSASVPTWFAESQFLATQTSKPKWHDSEADVALLLTFPRVWYEVSWPTYDDLPQAVTESGQVEPMRFRDRRRLDNVGLHPWVGGTEYIGMAPVECQPSFSFGPYDLESGYLPQRWTGPIGLFRELTDSSELKGKDISLAEALECLHLNGFTSSRLDDEVVLVGHGQCIVELRVAGELVAACRFLKPHEALARVAAVDASFVAQNGRTASVREIEQNVVVYARSPVGSFPISRGSDATELSRAVSYSPPPVTAANGAQPWAGYEMYLMTSEAPAAEGLCSSAATASPDCSRPSWLPDPRLAPSAQTNPRSSIRNPRS